MNLPPFTTLCLLRCSSPTQKSNVDFLEKAVLILSNRTDINVIGPLPSLVSKSKGNYRHQVYIHAPKKTFLNKVLKFLTTEFEKWPESNKVKGGRPEGTQSHHTPVSDCLPHRRQHPKHSSGCFFISF